MTVAMPVGSYAYLSKKQEKVVVPTVLQQFLISFVFDISTP